MRVADRNWMQIEEYLKHDDRAVLPLGCTEQHAYLSLATDSILAERVAVEAAEPLGVPVFPVVAYGITPNFGAYPGTVSLRIETFLAIVRDALDALRAQGFRRVVIVNGHGGNAPAAALRQRVARARTPASRSDSTTGGTRPRCGPRSRRSTPSASHASWMENFPWTRLAGVTSPDVQKPMVDWLAISSRGPGRRARGPGRRQLRRPLRAAGRGRARVVARCCGGDARADRALVTRWSPGGHVTLRFRPSREGPVDY